MVAVPIPDAIPTPQGYRPRFTETTETFAAPHAAPFSQSAGHYAGQTPGQPARQSARESAWVSGSLAGEWPSAAKGPVAVPPSSNSPMNFPANAQANTQANAPLRSAVDVSDKSDTSDVPATQRQDTPSLAAQHTDWKDWANLLAAGSLLAAGALVLTGHRRAGLAVAAAGTALALVEERAALAAVWQALPGYLNEAQSLAEQVEGFLQELATQGEKLQSILHR